MNNLQKAFKKKAFIPFITCGDPDINTTEKIIFAMIENGADLIELGIPFSDPMAEGIVIQEANMRALKNGKESILSLKCLRGYKTRLRFLWHL